MNSKKLATILIVDDTPHNLQVLSVMLESQGYQVKKAISGQFALQGVKLAQPDLILLDVYMPEMNGYDVCQKLKSMSETKDIPVIFISASDNVTDKVKAFEVGGVDYIIKPFQAEEILVRVNNQLTLRSLAQQLKKQNALLQKEIRERQESEARESEKIRELEILIEQLKSTQSELLQLKTQSTFEQLIAEDLHPKIHNFQYFFEHLSLTRKYCQNLIHLVQIYNQNYPNPVPTVQQFIEEINLNTLLIDLPRIIDWLQSELKWMENQILQQSLESKHPSQTESG
ncbi:MULTISPECIES: response regulator [Nostocales]|uniref:Response regulator n=3 Tax=Nostocales TaxID=1161 RepID=A0A8S9SW07_9CYAN|nr:response regulator [Tolypothrix bouteillei]KAF3883997.1 response regulator [Tolypothrix bouteillei VB521301]